MNSCLQILRGTLATVLLACGFHRLADRLDPLRQQLPGGAQLHPYSASAAFSHVTNWRAEG